jgi:hypothetical protein
MEQKSHWAKLTAEHIARLGELTKREIQVICFLYLCRNGKNDRCDPRRSTIAAGTGLARPHVTVAIAGLISKGWIFENLETGEFDLLDAGEIPEPKVTNLVTNAGDGVDQKVTNLVTVTDLVTEPEVTNLVTTVTDLVTNSYQNGNSHIKDIEQTNNREGTERARRGKSKKAAKHKPNETRIPPDWKLTPELKTWYLENVPKLRMTPETAADEFVDYWTNRTDAKSWAVDWDRKFKTGMRRLLEFQEQRDAAARAKNGGREPADWRSVGKVSEPAQAAATICEPECIVCDGSGYYQVENPTAAFEFDRLLTQRCPNARVDGVSIS